MKYRTLTMTMLEPWACDQCHQLRPIIRDGLVLNKKNVEALIKFMIERWGLEDTSVNLTIALQYIISASASDRPYWFANRKARHHYSDKWHKARIGACMAEILHWSRGGK